MKDVHDRERRPSLTPGGRVVVDEAERVRDWFDLRVPPLTAQAFAPDDLARGFLARHAGAFGWAPALADLRPTATLEVAGALSVRFAQEHHGLPVDASEVIVNLRPDSRVHSVYSQYRYGIPATLRPAAARVDAVHARQVAARLTRMFAQRAIGPPRLIVYPYREHGLRPANRSRRPPRARAAFVRAARARLARAPRPAPGAYVLAWDVRVATRRPLGRWRVLVDAVSGRTLDVLVDSKSRRREWELSGRTGGNTVVNLAGDPGWIGQTVPVRITGANPNSLRGEAVLDGKRPRA